MVAPTTVKAPHLGLARRPPSSTCTALAHARALARRGLLIGHRGIICHGSPWNISCELMFFDATISPSLRECHSSHATVRAFIAQHVGIQRDVLPYERMGWRVP
jgi:hypothetical protein